MHPQRFWYSRSVDPWICVSNKFTGDVGATGTKTTLWETTVLIDNGETNIVLNEDWQPFKICIPDKKGETSIINIS